MSTGTDGARRDRLVATPDEAGTRLDVLLATRLPELSRSQIQRLIREDHVTLNQGRAKPGLIVREGLTIDVEVPPPVPAVPEPEALPLTILYEDRDMVVVDKPAGLVVHPAAGHPRGTLVNALLHHVTGLSGVGGQERPGIVHRLDRGTSGVMVVAKHDRAHRALARQFHDRRVTKEYVALVWGTARVGQTIDTPIGRDMKARQKISSRSRRARSAVTRIDAVDRLPGVSLVRVTIGTGRTHQIRVHLSEAGHPVVGDALYGGVRAGVASPLAALAGLDRPFLHALRLGLAHPVDGRPMTFVAPLAADLARILRDIGGANLDNGTVLAPPVVHDEPEPERGA